MFGRSGRMGDWTMGIGNRAARIAAAAVLTASLGVMAADEGGSHPAAVAPLSAANAAQSGGTFVDGLTTLWSGNFMPALSDTQADVDIAGNEFLSLLAETPAAQLTTYGSVTSKYTVSKNRRTFTFWLNPKARWSDGRRVTARDVALYLQWVSSTAYVTTLGGPYAGSWGDIVGMTEKNGDPLPNGTTPSGFKMLGPYKFSITITKPYANALINEVAGITPLPYFVLHKYPMQDWDKISFDHFPDIGDGPWIMSKIIPDEVVLQTANPYFVDGTPRIPTYEWKYVVSKVAPGDLIKGLLNYYEPLEAKYYSALKDTPTTRVVKVTGLGYSFIGWRLNNSKYGKEFDNVHFRRGVLYAINRNALNAAYNKGLGTVETGPLPNVYSWYDPAANTGRYAYAYNPQKAIQEFKAAGLVLNPHTHWFDLPNGQPFKPTLMFQSGSTTIAEEATSIGQYLHAAHLDLIVDPPTDFNTIIQEITHDRSGTQPVQGYMLNIGYGSDPSFYSIIGSQSGFNLDGWDITDQTLPNFQPEDMKLLTEQKSAAAYNYAYRKKVLDEWQVLFSKYVPFTILTNPDILYGVSADLRGVVISSFGAFYQWKWYFANSNS